MRASGSRNPIVFCSDHHCSHCTHISADRWPDELRLSDLELLFRCKVCGKRGADVRPDLRHRRGWARRLMRGR